MTKPDIKPGGTQPEPMFTEPDPVRPRVQLTCGECGTVANREPIKSVDPRYPLAWCERCKRRTAHTR